MEEVSIIGVDLAKNVFQLHGAAADGSVVYRRKLSRPQFARFMADHPACKVAMEACPSAHHWARELTGYGHRVRLIAPHYVKPFLKRQKNDAADAEAIVEAALRPTMRFVEPKTAEQQARAVAFRTREQLVKQRTEAVNALRSHLYEFGNIAPMGIGHVPRLARVVADPDAGIPDLARDICRMLLEQIAQLADRITALKARIAAMSNEAEMPRRLQTMHSPLSLGPLARHGSSSGRSLHLRSKPLRRRWSSSAGVVTSSRRAGSTPSARRSAWCRGSIPLAASRSWGRHRRWGNASPMVARTSGATIGNSGDCWSSGRRR